MSGGHWGSAAFLIQENLSWVADSEESDLNYVKDEYPELSKILLALGDTLYEIIHAMDYDVSGDSFIKNKKVFEKQAIEKLNQAIKGDKDEIK